MDAQAQTVQLPPQEIDVMKEEAPPPPPPPEPRAGQAGAGAAPRREGARTRPRRRRGARAGRQGARAGARPERAGRPHGQHHRPGQRRQPTRAARRRRTNEHARRPRTRQPVGRSRGNGAPRPRPAAGPDPRAAGLGREHRVERAHSPPKPTPRRSTTRYVTLQIDIRADGALADVRVLSDPGNGFGREARSARCQRFLAALRSRRRTQSLARQGPGSLLPLRRVDKVLMADAPRAELARLAASLRAYLEWQRTETVEPPGFRGAPIAPSPSAQSPTFVAAPPAASRECFPRRARDTRLSHQPRHLLRARAPRIATFDFLNSPRKWPDATSADSRPRAPKPYFPAAIRRHSSASSARPLERTRTRRASRSSVAQGSSSIG